jgi:hypothetical protein
LLLLPRSQYKKLVVVVVMATRLNKIQLLGVVDLVGSFNFLDFVFCPVEEHWNPKKKKKQHWIEQRGWRHSQSI